MRAILLAILLLAPSLPVFSAEPYRIIAIMENERLLKVEPDFELVRFFRSPDPEIRARAILAAARIGNQAVLPSLRSCVTDDNPAVRKQVAFAI